jgi:biofilm PGA synthesis protein PgaD
MASVPENLHINVPELLSRRRRLSDAFVTGLMWVVYTYLWAPLLSLIAWVLGFEFAYDVMIRSGGIQGLKHVLVWYGIMLASICLVVTGWSQINRLRFSGHERRKGAAIVDDSTLASAFGVELSALQELRNGRVASLSLDADGRIQGIKLKELAQRERRDQNEASQLKKPIKIAG